MGLPALVAVSVLLLATVIFTFATISDRNRVVAESVREDALWASYQLDRETGRFILAVHEYVETRSEALRDDMLQRFDILYSRIGLLSNGEYAARFQSDPELSRLLGETKALIEGLAPVFDRITAAGTGTTDELVAARARAETLRAKTEALLSGANRRQVTQRVDDRAEVQRSYLMLGAGVLGLTFAMGAVIVVLWLQLRHIQRSERHLRQLTEQYAEAAKLAEAGNRAKSAFLAAMSHEIRTPLNGVVGMVELLADSTLSPDQARKLATIRECSDALLDIINDVLDFSKLESGAIDLEDRPFALRQMMESVIRIVQTRAVDKGLELTFDCPDLVVAGDQARIRQIVLNLAANAVKFTQTGSVSLVAKAQQKGAARGTLTVAVSDTGIGISPDAQARLFQEFAQGDASIRRRFGGTGLGLAICKKIAEAMGGAIVVESAEGRGSTFTLSVPVSRVEAAPAVSVTTDPGERLSAPRGGRVLVVEDNPTNQRVAAELLGKLGVETQAALNGEEAVAMVAAEEFDLVLMDMQMPVMDGLEATRRIRAAGHHAIPIIGLTANAFVSDREACLAAGMNDFLAKPATRAKLEGVLRSWLRSRPASSPSPAPVPAPSPVPSPAAAPVPAAVVAVPTASGPAPAVPPAGDEDALFEREQMASLRDELGPDMMQTLFESFWNDATQLSDMIAGALARGEDEPVRRGLHTLKGIAQTVGFRAVADAAIAAKHAYDETGTADLGALAAALVRTRAAAPPLAGADAAAAA